jgi:hypothetical protein
MVICSGWISNLGAMLSRSVVIVASIEAWLCGVEEAMEGASAVEYLLAVLIGLFGMRNVLLDATLGACTLIKLRTIIMKPKCGVRLVTARPPEVLMRCKWQGLRDQRPIWRGAMNAWHGQSSCNIRTSRLPSRQHRHVDAYEDTAQPAQDWFQGNCAPPLSLDLER